MKTTRGGRRSNALSASAARRAPTIRNRSSSTASNISRSSTRLAVPLSSSFLNQPAELLQVFPGLGNRLLWPRLSFPSTSRSNPSLEVYRESPSLREYRYIHRDNRTYVVEPQERRI